MNLFIASLKFDRPLTQLYRASLPYLLILLLVLLLITYWPQISIG
jgi:TRAP-type C4-dicarboxylate transport system permease large subunit